MPGSLHEERNFTSTGIRCNDGDLDLLAVIGGLGYLEVDLVEAGIDRVDAGIQGRRSGDSSHPDGYRGQGGVGCRARPQRQVVASLTFGGFL